MPSSILELPQLTITYDRPLPAQQHLLIAGGREPSVPWLKAAASGRHIWAIDHGIYSCQKAGLIPERLIGDGDSASASAWSWAEKTAAVVERYAPEKDFTDTQLALSTIKRAGQSVCPAHRCLWRPLRPCLQHTFFFRVFRSLRRPCR